MPSTIQESSLVLITGLAPGTGTVYNLNNRLECTLYYNYSGQSTGSNATIYLETQDSANNWGYTVDNYSFSGLGVQTNISTFSTPLLSIRGIISGVNSGTCQFCLNTSY